MKKSPETFTQLCDFLIADPSIKQAARDLRVNEATIFRWIQGSQQSPEEYSFEFAGKIAPLHTHVTSAMKMNSLLVESQARKMALDGWDEPVFFQGKQQWVECEIKAQCPGDLDWYMTVDGCRDPYQRDADGNRIPLTAKRKPSDALVLAVLKAYLPRSYGNAVDVNVNHGGHVMVVGAKNGKPDPNLIEHQPGEVIEHKPSSDRMAEIRRRMLNEANAHLSNPNRVTHPNAPVEKFDGGPDSEVHDRPPVVSRTKPMPAQPSQPPKTAAPYAPPYARQAAGTGLMGRGPGPNPRNVNGARGFNMNAPQHSGPRRAV